VFGPLAKTVGEWKLKQTSINQGDKKKWRARFSISDIGIVSDGGFSYQISDIGGDIGDTRAYRAFILDTIYNEILITI